MKTSPHVREFIAHPDAEHRDKADVKTLVEDVEIAKKTPEGKLVHPDLLLRGPDEKVLTRTGRNIHTFVRDGDEIAKYGPTHPSSLKSENNESCKTTKKHGVDMKKVTQSCR